MYALSNAGRNAARFFESSDSHIRLFAQTTQRLACAMSLAVGLALALGSIQPGAAEPAHGIAMIGNPALSPDFSHLPYANPDAPIGGEVVYGELGGFDSLHPYITKGRWPWGMRVHVFETLMGAFL